jgi:hypothetical protein
MSDSLKATVIVIDPVLTISTRPELLDDEDELLLELPRLPAVELALAPDPELEPEPELELEPDPEPEPPEIVSPGDTLSTLTTVPVAGAYSRVSLSVFSAVRRVASAPSTAAWAEAMLAAIVSALVVLVCPEPEPEPDPDPVLLDVVRVDVVGVAVDRVGVVLLWVVVVAGVVEVVVAVVAVVVLVGVVAVVVVPAPAWKVTN